MTTIIEAAGIKLTLIKRFESISCSLLSEGDADLVKLSLQKRQLQIMFISKSMLLINAKMTYHDYRKHYPLSHSRY